MLLGETMKILIIEDEIAMAKAIAHILEKYGYETAMIHDGALGLYHALDPIYDLILLDIMLPNKNGIDILKEVRQQNIKTPIIMLSAKAQIEDRILGLDSGADDYLPKPFEMDELIARIRAIFRRSYDVDASGLMHFSDITLDATTFELSSNKQSFKLTQKEFQVMEMFVMHPNTVISKENFIIKVWGYEEDVEDNIIEVYISFLRKKLKSLNTKVKIDTIRNAGYRLIESEKQDV